MARSKKPIWKSKIFWLAMIPIIIEVSQTVMKSDYLTDKAQHGMTFAISIATIIARYLSKGEAVTITK